MVTTANADAGGIHQRGDVVGVDTIHHKGGQGTALRLALWCGSQHAHAIDCLQAIEQMGGELPLPGLNLLQANGLEIAQGRAHSDGFADGGRSRLELVGEHRPGAVVQEDVLDHFAAAEEGRHRLKQGLAGPEESHPGGSAELVGRPHQEIKILGDHIDRLVGQALAGIGQHQSTDGVGRGDHLVQRVATAEGVADVHEADQPGAVVELGPEIVEIELTGLGDPDMAQDTAGALGQQLPGHEIAVVLHHREQHLITGLEVGVSPGARHQIDRLAGVTGEHDFARAGGRHEISGDCPGPFEGVGGPGAELMGAAMDVGVICGVIALQGVQHLARLLTGGRVIQIDQRLTGRSQLIENRKISTISTRNRIDITSISCRRGFGCRHALSPFITRCSGDQASAAAGSCSTIS